MSNRNTRSLAQSTTRTRPTGRSTTAVQRKASSAAFPGALSLTQGLEGYRLVAALMLVLLLVVSAFAPGLSSSSQAIDQSALVTPRIDGSNSVAAAYTNGDISDSIFRFAGAIERSQSNINASPNSISDILRYDPNSLRVRKAIVGQIIASSSGSLNQALIDSGVFSDLSVERIEAIESAYQGYLDKETNPDKGFNGLAAMRLVRSLNASGAERTQLERQALTGFQSVLNEKPDIWQYTYNWALTNFLMGNYTAAHEGMKSIVSGADKDNNKLPPFWMGLANLRLGETGEAIVEFNSVIYSPAPKPDNTDFVGPNRQGREASIEGLGDAQWANNDPKAAYGTYLATLVIADLGDTGLYSKWLRLGLEQRSYDQLLKDMGNLASVSSLGGEPRIHHDRARLLTFMGRTSEAEDEYNRAIKAGDDPSLHISYGQTLEAKGDHNGALSQAEAAIIALGKKPESSDLSSVAFAAVTTTIPFEDKYPAQQLLDAYVLRAHAWGKLNQKDNVTNLVQGITQQAGGLPESEVALLNLYAGFIAEAGGLNDQAVAGYKAAWDKFKGTAAGTPGRVAALAGFARATSAVQGQSAGLDILKANGYDPLAPAQSTIKDLDAPDLLTQGGLLLMQSGKNKEAANILHLAGVVANVQDARASDGAGRPIWQANGTLVPANLMMAAADAERLVTPLDLDTAVLRYKETLTLDPALAPAWNNLGVLYSQEGKGDLADFYLSSVGSMNPYYTLGQHNLATLEYKRGIGNFFQAEAAQGAAIKSSGPQTLSWGYNLRMDDRGPFPAPTIPSTGLQDRLPAILVLLLLLLHTLVGKDPQHGEPAKGLLGRLGDVVDARTRQLLPSLAQPRGGLLGAILIPSVIGMIALALAAGHGSLDVALLYLPAALVISLLAFGVHALAQNWMARASGATATHRIWPLGVLLGILSIPFSFVYGWQAVTSVPAPAHGHGGHEVDPTLLHKGRLGLNRESRIFFAGLAANLALALLFGLVYWLTAWPVMRLGLFASMLVLVFTAVSEPPADGWNLYKRNPSLWLALFVFAASVVALLAAGLV